MAASVFNIAKGRWAELHKRVDDNDPANCALIVLLLATTGLESDATLLDKDTVSDLVSGTTNEATNGGYARLTITDTGLAFAAPDDTNNRMDQDLADFNFGAISAGDSISKLVIAYDPDTTAGTDSTLIPLTMHDVTIIPDGSIVQVTVNALGYARAS